LGRISDAADYSASQYPAGRLRFYVAFTGLLLIGVGFAATAVYAAVTGSTKEDVGTVVAGCVGTLSMVAVAVWVVTCWGARGRPRRDA
jgi:hypothetical protein